MSNEYDEVDAVLRALPIPGQPGWEELTALQQQFVAMWIIEGQVGNGGWHAVYYNDCASCLPLASEGYAAIGAFAQAEICDGVLRTMQEDPWAGPPNTWPDPNAADPPPGSKDIGDFEDRWYALDYAELYRRKAAFIAAHPEELKPVS